MIENRMMTGNRVDCLYRVSTDKQVDYNDKSQADIPMQRRECHRFCEKMGWTIVHEEQEDGVSGHKVRAENRDKLQIIKERAKQGKFDILLVFMFDRIGRIADETPFVVEWFVKNGIRVWSTQEGEQRFDNHTDKLTNYIHFWQADGESAFPQDLLSSLISDCETKCLEVQHTMEAAQVAYDEGQAMLDALNAQYDDIISWADMYDSASMESKKMIVSCLIRRVEVYRDYRLHIDFNIDFEQFSAGLDISAIAA